MTVVTDRIKAQDDALDDIIELLLAESSISNIVGNRLLPESGNKLQNTGYPYGEVILVRKGPGAYGSNAKLDVTHTFLIEWYTDNVGPEGKTIVKTLAAATEAILEKNFSYGLWRNTTWKNTNVEGVIADKEGLLIERFSQVIFDFAIQLNRN